MWVFLALTALTTTQGSEAATILKQFEAARPTEAQLNLYKHDWAASFDDAKKRAADERRPIFLVAVQNLNGYDNLYTGHC